MEKPFVLHLTGPSASGKSTLLKALEEYYPGTYTVDYDGLKAHLAGYDRTKDGPLIDKILLGLFDVVCRQGIPIFLNFFFRSEDEYLVCRRAAEAHGYEFFDIRLTAPEPVLIERFHKRAAEAAQTVRPYWVKDEKTFLELLAGESSYFVPEGTPVFDTAVTSIADIVKEVRTLLPS